MKNQRLMSLDALRGFDMFFIMGLSGLVVSICNLWPGTVSDEIARQMSHVQWDGLTHHDTIFPLFLFLAGVSFPFSYANQISKGMTRAQIYAKIFRRATMLIFLGLIYNGLLNFNFETLRCASVLARIGIAWMGDTFINGNIAELTASIEGIVTEMPWLFGAALFVMSILLYSQAATVRAIVPLGIALGMSPMMLIALFPAVNGYFFIPNYPTVVAAINFDRTGTTGIGKYILNHSFMMPGLVATVVSLAVGLLLIQLF